LDLTVIMYHYVRDAGDAAEAGSGIAGLPVTAFEAQLDLWSREYHIVDWPTGRKSARTYWASAHCRRTPARSPSTMA
jgi:hypothetical protein